MTNKIFLTLVLCLVASSARAICLTNCEQETTDKNGYSVGYMADSVRYREKSHDTGDVKNSVMGDVNIHVGHKKMDVNIDKGSSNNSVNASVSSTIILGDMKQ